MRWYSFPAANRIIKRELRPTDDYTEEQLEELANRIVDLARRRSRQ